MQHSHALWQSEKCRDVAGNVSTFFFLRSAVVLFKTAPSGVNADFSRRAGFIPPQRLLRFHDGGLKLVLRYGMPLSGM